jgi:hypothetical protein
LSNQAGWKCDDCRKAGLERKRRCGWLEQTATGETIVWARKQTALTLCPKSFITAQSISWVEEFFVRQRLGGVRLEDMNTKDAEAFLILGEELAREKDDV